MADAPEIKVKLTAEDAGVAAAIKELGAQLKNLKTQQDETAASGLNLAKAFNAITAGVALVGLARIGKEAFDSAVNIGKMADKTGLTTQTLSVFHKVADDVGVSTEAVDKGLTKAAKSITEFQAGSVAAAKGFQLLGITQKDFLGLNPDQKIGLVTTKLGGMKAGLEKTAAAQLIFSRGGAEMIVVANAIAAQGMDKATEATARLGLLLDQTTTDSFRSAKASMQELTMRRRGWRLSSRRACSRRSRTPPTACSMRSATRAPAAVSTISGKQSATSSGESPSDSSRWGYRWGMPRPRSRNSFPTRSITRRKR